MKNKTLLLILFIGLTFSTFSTNSYSCGKDKTNYVHFKFSGSCKDAKVNIFYFYYDGYGNLRYSTFLNWRQVTDNNIYAITPTSASTRVYLRSAGEPYYMVIFYNQAATQWDDWWNVCKIQYVYPDRKPTNGQVTSTKYHTYYYLSVPQNCCYSEPNLLNLIK